MSRVLDFNNVTVLRDKKPIINNIDWQVESDQRWVIIGANGAGKTSSCSSPDSAKFWHSKGSWPNSWRG
jgi:ABC-type molybdenum transport system ATPase subunit/photorepair protein PhrA